MQAALLRVQLRNVGAKIAERRRLAHRYHELLRDYVVVPEERDGEIHTYQTYLIQAGDRDALQAHLRANGVEAIVHYATPLHLQPAAADLGYGAGSFPVTERLSDSILSLPLFPGMTAEQQDRVVTEIASFYDARDGAGS